MTKRAPADCARAVNMRGNCSPSQPGCRSRLRTSRRGLVAACTALTLATLLRGQELLAVDGQGRVLAINLATQQTRRVRDTAMGTCHALECKLSFDRSRIQYFAAAHDGQAARLYALDPLTAEPRLHIADLGATVVALSEEEFTTRLWGIADGAVDRLIRIDLTAGAVTTVGDTGLRDLQGLATVSGTLFGWDAALGLVTLDPQTGRALDVDPAVGAQGQNVQFLTIDRFGALLGGGDLLFGIDTSTGVLTPLPMSGLADVRGADTRFGHAQPFGTACFTPRNNPASLLAQGDLVADAPAFAASPGHLGNAPAALLVGLSDRTFAGVPLPIAFDPLFGTRGCTLQVSIDLTVPGVASAGGFVQIPLTLTGAAGRSVFWQLVVLQPVPGGMTLTHGVAVHVPR